MKTILRAIYLALAIGAIALVTNFWLGYAECRKLELDAAKNGSLASCDDLKAKKK